MDSRISPWGGYCVGFGALFSLLAEIVRGGSGAPVARLPQKKQLRSWDPTPSSSLWVSSWVTVSPGGSCARRVGEFPLSNRCPYMLLWAEET